MEAAVAFYHDVLGLTEVERPGSVAGKERYRVRWFAVGDQHGHWRGLAEATKGHRHQGGYHRTSSQANQQAAEGVGIALR